MAEINQKHTNHVSGIRGFLAQTYASLTRPVPDFPHWKWHIAHVGIATAIAFFAFVGGMSLIGAMFIGSVVFPALRELSDLFRHGPSSDLLADLVQHY